MDFNKLIKIAGAELEKGRVQIWSSGGGMQSAAIAAMIVTGKIEKPDLAVIADTERERSSTWEYHNSVIVPALDSVGCQIYRVRKSKFASLGLYDNQGRVLIPAFTSVKTDIGKLPGYCSSHWKTRVVQRWAIKKHKVKSAQVWFGFSIDEVERATRMIKAKPGKWGVYFPLIERGMDRQECVALVRSIGWPTPPRSSCWMCPNHHMREWREIRASVDWQKVVDFEKQIQVNDPNLWLTDQGIPISEADFSEAQEVMFGRDRGECTSGMCFV